MIPKTCPSCNADFQGNPIPIRDRKHYGNKTHFSRIIAIYSRDTDRTEKWRCPDCKHEWLRHSLPDDVLPLKTTVPLVEEKTQ
jgi:hypothetical protein